MKPERYWIKRYGLNLTDLRKIFYAVQEQRCACCRMQVEFMGVQSSYDRVTKTIICRRCRLPIVSFRKLPIKLLPRILEFVNGNYPVNNPAKTAEESQVSVQTTQTDHKGNFPP